MKVTRKLLASLVLLAAGYAPAQINRPLSEYVPPEKAFHTIFDKDGNRHNIEDLQVRKPGDVPPATPGKKYSSNQTNVIGSMSTAGFFNLYFEAGSLCDVNSAARACCEQVFKDLSNFIISPLSNMGNPVRVNMHIKDMNVLGPGPNATATSYFAFPLNPTNPDQGLLEGLVYKTIVSGTDPYNTIPLALATSATFYHGEINFRPAPFLGSWNFAYTGGIGGSDADFYTITLHEAMHALGFHSFISTGGVSMFGATNNYFGRYDAFLTDASGNPLLSQPSPCTTGSGMTYTASTGLLNPGTCPGGPGSCATSIKFMSPNVNVQVYNPDCFAPGSSLSHFEDRCVIGYVNGICPTNISPSYADDMYYVMSEANGLGQCYVKRYPKAEERYALCDLGYTVKNNYTSTDFAADIDGGVWLHSYGGSQCNPPLVYGVNDGIVNNVFTYNTTGSSLNIPLNALLSNDISTNPLSVTCVEVIYVNGFNNATASIIGSNLTVNATPGCGLVILKYTPQDNGGVYGNATYVFVQFLVGGCSPPGNCNMVQNGGFELLSSAGINPDCGRLNIELPSNSIACWDLAIGTPHAFTRNCSANTVYELGVNTVGSSPNITNSFNGTPNDRVMGLYGTFTSGVALTQALKNNLSSPLIPGGQYMLSFAALNAISNAGGYNNTGVPVVITVASLPTFASPVTSSYPGSLNVIAQFTISASTNWSMIQQGFTFSGPANHSALVIGINSASIPTTPGIGLFCYIDEVSVLPAPWPSFSLGNPTICGSQSIANLQQFASVQGTFSGPGVTFNGTQYDFNLAQNLSPGAYPIGFTYNLNGCTNTMYQFVTISTNTLVLALTQSVCASNMTLALSSLITVPSLTCCTSFSVNGAGASGVYTFPSQGSYTITAQTSGACNNFASVIVQAYSYPPQPMISSSAANYCLGDPSLTLTAFSSGPNYVWMPGSVQGNTISVTPTVSTTYTVYAYDGDYCATPNTFAVTISTNCCQTSLPLYGANPYGGNILPAGFYNTPMAFVSDVTIPSGATVIFDDVECVFAPGVKMIVQWGATLILRGVHFYSCGAYLWKGIEIQNGGYLYTTTGTGLYNNHNLIEDAEIAIDVTNYNAPSPVFELHNVTFNKNYIDINIDNFTFFYVANHFMIDNCVFTCRNFGFTATNWPSTDISTGLRYTPNANGLTVPYLQPVVTAAVTNLKGPYFNQPSHIAIRLTDVANTFLSPPNYQGLLFGTGNPNDFNLFDGHGYFISGFNSNVSSMNNVFQNTQRYQTSPGVWEGGSAIRLEVNNTWNTQLDLRSTSFSNGNRFWDCHTAIEAIELYNLRISLATFRSNQNVHPTPGYLPGNTGIKITTNRFDYEIGTNVFNNINDCINIDVVSGTYNMSGTPATGIYADHIKIHENYFGPQVSSGMPLTNGEYLNRAIRVSGSPTASWQQFNSMDIQSNRVDRGYRGIVVDGMASYPTNIQANVVELLDDNWILPQNGIELTNMQDDVIVSHNWLSGSGPFNNNMSMMYCKDNPGTSSSPDIQCNDVMNSYNGFVFDGNNSATVWKRNTMQSHARGYVLANSGVIGQQGSSGNPSDNSWLGSWTGGDVQTYVLNSDASLSPLYVITGNPALDPTVHGGSVVPFTTYAATGTKFNAVSGSVSCPVSTLPTAPNYRNAGTETAIQKNSIESAWTAEVFPNPNQGKMYLQSVTESEALHVKVVDVSGKQIYERTLLTTKHLATIELDLEQGVYFMTIRNNETGNSTVKRVIIAK